MSQLTSLLEEVISKNEATTDRVMEKASQCIVIGNHHGGVALKSSYDNTTTQGMIKHVAGTLVNATRSAVRDIDPTDELCYMRVMTKKCEYLISEEAEFTIVVQQQRL